jgi:hypothetical protein
MKTGIGGEPGAGKGRMIVAGKKLRKVLSASEG